MFRQRRAKILATLGPATSSPERIGALVEAGVDAFRFNFSHGTHDDHAARHAIVRGLEGEIGRPIGILMDLQGPKLRVGRFRTGRIALTNGDAFRLDLDPEPGDQGRVSLPHPEIFQALVPGTDLLLNDGRIRLEVRTVREDHAETVVRVGGALSDAKGVNVPRVVLPISAMTPKDHDDLRFGLDLGVDWVALSFVQRAADVAEARRLIAGRAAVMVKVEKPACVDSLDEIMDQTDGMMVARGDLGVEMPPELVPGLQKRIIRACRDAGKPVVVATQMLESMITNPAPTRAEASDVATAVYDGADTVMLSAETAAGDYPVEAVAMMKQIIMEVERDPLYRSYLGAYHAEAEATSADAITAAAAKVANVVRAAAIVTYTSSGATALRAARERPDRPILGLINRLETARRLSILWGVHGVVCDDVHDIDEMVGEACRHAIEEGMAGPGDKLVITAGMPFGTPGATNLLRIAWVS
ncbi:MAG TPA: pyruvate kinase [Geminicoccaceae bacterium]|nr:pyruvate kinase [Geminicoccaceae bacterium]